MNKELEGVLKEFEITEGQPFCVNGQPYIDVVRNTEDSRKPRRVSIRLVFCSLEFHVLIHGDSLHIIHLKLLSRQHRTEITWRDRYRTLTTTKYATRKQWLARAWSRQETTMDSEHHNQYGVTIQIICLHAGDVCDGASLNRLMNLAYYIESENTTFVKEI